MNSRPNLSLLQAMFACLLFILFGAQCGVMPEASLKWHLIVPDGYEGIFAIHYDCKGGVPLPIKNNTVTVVFDEQGIFCTSDDSFPYEGSTPMVQSSTEKIIPYITDPYTYKGYAACCERLSVIGGGTFENPGEDLTLGMFWVGFMEPHARNESPFPVSHYKEFLSTRFGLRDIEDYEP